MAITINDIDLLLHDFADIWFTNCDSRYRLLKGGRSTGKSYDFIGLEPIFKILSDSRRNIVFVRQNYKDNGTSTYNQVKKCIFLLKLQHLFKFNTSPLKIIRIQTGQAMLFGGMNDVDNLLSTTFEVGYWTDIYFEEASQLKSYEDFRRVDGSMRIPNTEPDLKCQITFLFNAWDVGHWTNDIFFKGYLDDNISELESKGYQFASYPDFNLGQDGSGLSLHISSYKCNKYNSPEKVKNILEMKNKSYDIYLVEALGCWGNTKDAVYPEFNDGLIIHPQEANKMRYLSYAIGIDTGLSNGEGKILKGEDVLIRSATTMQLVGLTEDSSKIICINEFFHSNEQTVNKKGEPELMVDIVNKIKEWQELYINNWTLLKGVILVYVDCADIGFRQGLELRAKEYGLYNVRFMPSTKMKIQTRVDFERTLMAMGEIKYSESCPNLIREIRNARRGDKQECRADINNHALDAHEYAEYPLLPRLIRWKQFKTRD